MPTGKSPDDAFLLSSDEESDSDRPYDGQSDISLPPLSELCWRATKNVEPGSIFPEDARPHAVSGPATAATSGNRDAEELLEQIDPSEVSAFSQRLFEPFGALPTEQDRAVFIDLAVNEAEPSCGGTTLCTAAKETSHESPPGAQTPHLPSPGPLATSSLQPDNSPQQNAPLNGAWSTGNSDEAGRPTLNSVESDTMITPATLGSGADIDMVTEEPLLTRGSADEIAESPQEQPSGLEDCPLPTAVPSERMSPVSQSPHAEQYRPSQGLLSRSGSVPCEGGQTSPSNATYDEPADMTSPAASAGVRVPSLPTLGSPSMPNPARLEEPVPQKRKLRPRTAALGNGRHSRSNSSGDSGDEGTDTYQDDDDDFLPRQRKRRKGPPKVSIRPRSFSCGVTSGKRFGRHSIPSPLSSRDQSDEGDTAEMLTAVFEEWPLKDAVLKRVTEGGLTTFQLQFTWASHATRGPGPKDSATDELDDAATPEAVDDATQVTTTPDPELTYNVERIEDHKFTRRNNQGLQFYVKWEDDPKRTWEPAEALENGVAYDEYVAHNDISKPSTKPKRGRGRPRKSVAVGAVPGG